MRLALLWALGLLGAGSPLPSRPLPNIGGTEEQQARPVRALGRPWELQVLPDNLTLSLAEVLQTSLPEALRIKLELDGESHILELLQKREVVASHPTLVWYQPDGTQVVSEGHTLENCCYQGGVQGHADSWVSVCTCSGLRGLVVLSPERSYYLELEPGDLQGPPIISRIQDLLPSYTCTPRWGASVPTQAPPEVPLGWRHIRRQRRDVVTETKTVELVIVADHSEVQRYPDFQRLLNRTLEVALLLDMFFRPLNVRVALVGLEAWTQHNQVEISSDAGITLDNFLRWRRAELLPRLPHDSAQLVTATSFSGPMVGMAIQNSICSPDFSGGVNMDCNDPCCDYFTCQLRPGAQCASDGPCCQNCQLRPAGWQCRPKRGDCDLPEFCLGDSSQCPPDISLGDGEPCAGGQAVCMQGRCASYTQQCQALWGPGAQPAASLCLHTANTRGNAFGSCGRSPNGSYMPCSPRDTICGQLQCQGGRVQPLLGSVQDLLWEMVEANGTQLNCSWVHLDLGNDVAQPLLTLPGTACGPGLVCIDHQCQPVDLLGAQECRSKCHGHGACNSNRHCHCEEGWAPPDCTTQIRVTSSLNTGLLLSLLLLLVLVLLGVSYWHRAHLRQRLCQLKGPSCQYRAAQSGPPERPGPPQRALLRPGTKQTSALGFPAPPSRPLPPDPVPKRLQAVLADRPSPPTRPLPADPVVRRPKGPVKPPPPRKPLPSHPQNRRPSGDPTDSAAGMRPLVVPSRPAPPPPEVSSLYL
ncbi:disintegrin and metalloproteinase domain-containing protein 15 isoform X10 [Choloepus didactylus]|uniref:disintegrin and metalloproteinase domain-containing protein 15 isoform X10 n=1 Tax=Choloepus didactylus TaxID=27675 RepID=UPI00189D0BFC|nr:disintegrin and metalloproteinase domain-containing protein 15 isoform X10 [Choloepus didactylus]